jgi:hypothetical protein
MKTRDLPFTFDDATLRHPRGMSQESKAPHFARPKYELRKSVEQKHDASPLAEISPFLFLLISALITLPSSPARADVVDYFANAEAGRRLEFGDGHDGAFVDGPAQAGISVVGATITIDTSVKNVFQFTSFTLSAGHTLNATGASPLIVRVAGTATVGGQIHLDGAAGGNSAPGAPGVGGLAGAGGGNGGVGGKQPNAPIEPTPGDPATGNSLGGGKGPNDPGLSGQREGGGGCHGPGSTGGLNFPASAVTCPSSFLQVADGFDTAYTGGGGGGGGGTRIFDATNGTNGAGGGGAGGALNLSASSDITVSGSITANGGAGGNGAIGTSDYGASGGGGSGGSIWIQSAARVSGNGTLAVAMGTGGADGFSGSIGGSGSRGVIRIDATTPAFAGTFTPAGSADRTFNVFPVTVEFGISAGPACGTVSRHGHEREDVRDFAWNTLLGFVLFFAVNRGLNARSAKSSRFGQAS